MRNEHDAALELFQEAFQPVDGGNVQVVGRFVQQQYAWRADQRTPQRRFTQPTAGQRGKLRVPVQAQLQQHFADAAVELPKPLVIEDFHNLRHTRQVFFARIGFHQVRNRVIGLQVFRLLGHAFGHEIEYCPADIARGILLQTRNDQILLVNHPAIVQRNFFTEDLQQRGFTGAITPNQTNAFVVFNMNFGVI
ncbi:hypothetical protein D3C79_569800 [compost metagenome]